MASPRPRTLDRERLVATALRLIDAEGIDVLTMKRLGDELGLSAMAMYRHVANKQALLALAADSLFEQIVVPGHDAGPWDLRLRTMMEAIFALCAAHPWVPEVLHTRERSSDPAPNSERVRTGTLEILQDAGFEGTAAILAAGAVADVVTGVLFQTRLRAQHRPYDAPVPDHHAFTLDTLFAGLRRQHPDTGPMGVETSSDEHRRPSDATPTSALRTS